MDDLDLDSGPDSPSWISDEDEGQQPGPSGAATEVPARLGAPAAQNGQHTVHAVTSTPLGASNRPAGGDKPASASAAPPSSMGHDAAAPGAPAPPVPASAGAASGVRPPQPVRQAPPPVPPPTAAAPLSRPPPPPPPTARLPRPPLRASAGGGPAAPPPRGMVPRPPLVQPAANMPAAPPAAPAVKSVPAAGASVQEASPGVPGSPRVEVPAPPVPQLATAAQAQPRSLLAAPGSNGPAEAREPPAMAAPAPPPPAVPAPPPVPPPQQPAAPPVPPPQQPAAPPVPPPQQPAAPPVPPPQQSAAPLPPPVPAPSPAPAPQQPAAVTETPSPPAPDEGAAALPWCALQGKACLLHCTSSLTPTTHQATAAAINGNASAAASHVTPSHAPCRTLALCRPTRTLSHSGERALGPRAACSADRAGTPCGRGGGGAGCSDPASSSVGGARGRQRQLPGGCQEPLF